MPNPNVPQGTLNRLLASVSWTQHPELNVTAPFLNNGGITFSRDGEATVFLPTQTGVVTSANPFQMVTVQLPLLKTQGLAAQYEKQLQSASLIGPGVVRPDVSEGIGAFDILNCAIETIRELNFSGGDAGYNVIIKGYMNVNNGLWP